MAISKKKAMPVRDPQLSRVVAKIYDDLNELITAINSLSKEHRDDTGKPGDMRFAKDSDGNYYIEGRGDDGWYTTASLDFKTKYKN